MHVVQQRFPYYNFSKFGDEFSVVHDRILLKIFCFLGNPYLGRRVMCFTLLSADKICANPKI